MSGWGGLMNWLRGNTPHDEANNRLKQAASRHESVARRAVVLSARRAVQQDDQREALDALLEEMERRRNEKAS